jgi:hypothetical protein
MIFLNFYFPGFGNFKPPGTKYKTGKCIVLKKKKGGKAQPPDSVPSAMLLLNKIFSKCETDVTSVSIISTPHFAKKLDN